MKKKIVAYFLIFLLFLAATTALACVEVAKVKPFYYDQINDIPAWKINLRNLSDELVQELRGGTFTANLLPIDDDTLLWYGYFEYHKQKREEWHTIEYDVDIPREDAYAVAVDMQGTRKWSLALSDPHAQNSFDNARLLPDGRIIFWHNNAFGEWGSHYYIVSKDGEVQEMLPSYKVKDQGVYATLRPMHGGYLGGGACMEDGALGAMYNVANFAFFDKELNLLWENQTDEYAPAQFGDMWETSDGFLISGTYYSGYNPDTPMINQAMLLTPMVSKIGLGGETIWVYKGNELSATGAADIVATADGGALFTTSFDPTAATPFEAQETGTLVKLNHNGELEWVKQYTEEHPFSYFLDLLPYKQGFLASGLLTGDSISWAVLYITADGVPIDRIDIDLDGAENSSVALVTAPNGSVYAYGTITTSKTILAGMDQKTDCRPFYLNISDLFQ